MRRGEVVFLIDTSTGMLRLLPAETHDIGGGVFPDEWEYRLTVAGPSRTLTYNHVPYSSVLHFRYAVDAARPWRGNSPLDVASLTGQLSAETLRVLSDEASGPVGRMLGHTQRRQRRNGHPTLKAISKTPRGARCYWKMETGTTWAAVALTLHQSVSGLNLPRH